ncbi:hypothetical protein Lfu02_35640 [Longispora fulva]|uniref:Uncharacterized protein n=1 Tax=Longispora fulva TaxID=619741 RepID=A0A8J7GQV2_9ACTN|nr:hypothetical protein [Longispora fulva]MBG6141653.1 hypothetical protein [Longispora fulva]GIG59192.1 hypothetical protein Lfu02_35640 [Longispora fulva]
MTRTGQLAALVGLGAVALVLAPGVAGAATVAVSPGAVAPGGTVEVAVAGDCRPGSGIFLAGPTAPGVAGVSRVPDVVSRLGAGGRGAITVPRNGRPGTWSLWVSCEDGTAPGAGFAVSSTGRPGSGDGTPAGGPDTGLITSGGGVLVLAAAASCALLVPGRPDDETG